MGSIVYSLTPSEGSLLGTPFSSQTEHGFVADDGQHIPDPLVDARGGWFSRLLSGLDLMFSKFTLSSLLAGRNLPPLFRKKAIPHLQTFQDHSRMVILDVNRTRSCCSLFALTACRTVFPGVRPVLSGHGRDGKTPEQQAEDDRSAKIGRRKRPLRVLRRGFCCCASDYF